MEINQTIYKCDQCGKYFVFGSDADGIPNGVQFHFSDGSIFTLCKGCISRRYDDAIKMVESMIEAKKQETKQY